MRALLVPRRLVATILTSCLVSANFWVSPTGAQTTAYCQLSEAAQQEKEVLLKSALKGNKDDQSRYKALLINHASQLQACRSRTWPQTEAIWLRLYPCDLRSGALDEVMDRIVNRGYNEVYLEVFYDGQVLLPAAANPTVWPAVIKNSGAENTDLLAQAIQKAHERGLKIYAWMFMMNFGYSYSLRQDRQSVLARNGKGQMSIDVVDNASQVFVDPYSIEAKRDYFQLVQEVVKRRPDGLLFDYVRYPRSLGQASIATKVQDLWVYSDASREALYQRGLNNKGRELIRRFVTQGYVTVADVAAVDKLYLDEGEPLWQGRTPPASPPDELPSAAQRQPSLQWELWQLSVAHALQGVLDFLAVAIWPAQQQGIRAGAVFFADGNQMVGQGYDSRLQPWNRFPKNLEWHPMAYGTCGNASCVTALVERVMKYAPPGTQVIPAIAGVWGKAITNRPPLEVQMQAIRQATPQVKGVSHFAFSWQEPQLDNNRKFCQNRN